MSPLLFIEACYTLFWVLCVSEKQQRSKQKSLPLQNTQMRMLKYFLDIKTVGHNSPKTLTAFQTLFYWVRDGCYYLFWTYNRMLWGRNCRKCIGGFTAGSLNKNSKFGTVLTVLILWNKIMHLHEYDGSYSSEILVFSCFSFNPQKEANKQKWVVLNPLIQA